MKSVVRLEEPTAEQTAEEVRTRFGPLIVAYFVRAIDSLNQTPRGPQLAMRRVWAEQPLLAPPSTDNWDSAH